MASARCVRASKHNGIRSFIFIMIQIRDDGAPVSHSLTHSSTDPLVMMHENHIIKWKGRPAQPVTPCLSSRVAFGVHSMDTDTNRKILKWNAFTMLSFDVHLDKYVRHYRDLWRFLGGFRKKNSNIEGSDALHELFVYCRCRKANNFKQTQCVNGVPSVSFLFALLIHITQYSFSVSISPRLLRPCSATSWLDS